VIKEIVLHEWAWKIRQAASTSNECGTAQVEASRPPHFERFRFRPLFPPVDDQTQACQFFRTTDRPLKAAVHKVSITNVRNCQGHPAVTRITKRRLCEQIRMSTPSQIQFRQLERLLSHLRLSIPVCCRQLQDGSVRIDVGNPFRIRDRDEMDVFLNDVMDLNTDVEPDALLDELRNLLDQFRDD